MARTINDIEKTFKAARPACSLFAVAVFCMLLAPLVGMIWAPTNQTVENRELASWPAVYDEESGLNTGFLSQAGDYFSDHYAYRVPLIDAGAHIYAGVFGVSTADTVIVGSDRWLYYAGTLNDYQDRAPLSESKAFNIAYNLRLLQDYCKERGASFAFAVAPDKNSLYGENMPYYLPGGQSEDMALLDEKLEEQGVAHADLYKALSQGSDRLYYLRDSHWTEKGALLAQDAIMDALEAQPVDFDKDGFKSKDDYTGDLAKMLFPDSESPETYWYIPGVNDGSGRTETLRSGSKWEFMEGDDVEDSTIATSPSNAKEEGVAHRNGKLLMFRDSFGNSLVPYMACEFAEASFSKLIPYNALSIEDEDVDAVVVERAQRHVGMLATDPPLMHSPSIDLIGTTAVTSSASASCEASTNGPLACVRGFIDGMTLNDSDTVYVRMVDGEGAELSYKAFRVSDEDGANDQGYLAYADLGLWEDQEVTAQVLVERSGEMLDLGTFDVRFTNQ